MRRQFVLVIGKWWNTDGRLAVDGPHAEWAGSLERLVDALMALMAPA